MLCLHLPAAPCCPIWPPRPALLAKCLFLGGLSLEAGGTWEQIYTLLVTPSPAAGYPYSYEGLYVVILVQLWRKFSCEMLLFELKYTLMLCPCDRTDMGGGGGVATLISSCHFWAKFLGPNLSQSKLNLSRRVIASAYESSGIPSMLTNGSLSTSSLLILCRNT